MLVLPYLEVINRKILIISNGVHQVPYFCKVSAEDQSLASSTQEALENIINNYFLTVTCLINSGH